jgi:hypothetical protein
MKTWILSFGAAFMATCFFAPDIGLAFVSAIVFACVNTAAWIGIHLFIGALKCPNCGQHDLEVTSIAASCKNCEVIYRRNARD